jgi:DNA-binding NarL/FixJ family response regulator
MAIRVLIVDDHAIMREGLRTLIAGRDDMDVVGEASDGASALQLAASLAPDVVVLDVSMPGMNGIETARRLCARCPGIRIVALSAHADRRFVAEMLRAGACGYLPKDDAFDELALAVRAAVAGKTYVGPGIAGDVLRDYVSRLPERLPKPHETLSAREREVLVSLAEGRSVKETAYAMGISSKTVETFRHRLMRKMNFRVPADLTKYAIREGLIPLDG